MKSSWILTLLLLCLVAMVGCRPDRNSFQASSSSNNSTANTLTQEKVQRALNRWIGKDGSLNVQGIQELPQQNAAKVDFNVQHFEWNEQYIGKKYYKGPASAVFTRYNDNRWVLTDVSMTNDVLARWKTNIVVE